MPAVNGKSSAHAHCVEKVQAGKFPSPWATEFLTQPRCKSENLRPARKLFPDLSLSDCRCPTAFGQVCAFHPSSSGRETWRAHDLSVARAQSAPRPQLPAPPPRPAGGRGPGEPSGRPTPRAPRPRPKRPAQTLSSPRNVGFRAERGDSLRGDGRQRGRSSPRGHRDPAV